MNKMNMTALCVALSGAAGAIPANAADTGAYVGLSVGQSEARKYCNNVVNCDSTDTSFHGEVGYRFNSMLGAEFGYTSFGTLLDASNNDINAEQDVSAWTISALGTWPVSEQFGIYGRVGIAAYNFSNSGTVQGVAVKDDNDTKPYFGAGVRFALNENWALRAEYQRFTDISGVDGSNDSVQAMYGGATYSF